MKNLYQHILTLAMLLAVTTLSAQIPNDSPIPVDVIIEIPESGFIRQIDDYVSVTNSVEWGIQPLRQTVSGEVVWVNDDDLASDGLDTLGCDTTSMVDYTDKIVLVRRGECFFSDKIYYAQEAGAIGVIIINSDGSDATGGMSAGDDKALDVTIPAVFINQPSDGALFIPQLDAGETVVATFRVRGFFGELGPNIYATPQSQIRTMDSIKVDLLNLDPDNPILDASASVDITDPSGNSTAYTSMVDSILPDQIHTFEFDNYTPSEVGLYEMVYTNSLTTDTIFRQFEVTDYTFQMDNGNIPEWPADSWIAPGEETFINDYFLIYEFGNLFNMGETETQATHITFSVANWDTLVTGISSADQFRLSVYNTDPDGDGVGAIPEHIDYSNYTLAGRTEYVFSGEEEPYELITVEFDNPIDLDANGQYLVMAQYDGTQSVLGKPPWYTYAGTEEYPGLSTMVFLDQLYTEGWDGDFRAAVRLHLAGYTPPSSQHSPLEVHTFDLSPNPAKDNLTLNYDFANTANEMTVRIVDMNGKVHHIQRYQDQKAGTLNFDVSRMPAGTYMLAVHTPIGHKIEKFVVVK